MQLLFPRTEHGQENPAILQARKLLSNPTNRRMHTRAESKNFRKILNEHYKATAPIKLLTNREFEVFHLVGTGAQTLDISIRLGISMHTANQFKHRIKKKLSLQNHQELTEAARLYKEKGEINGTK